MGSLYMHTTDEIEGMHRIWSMSFRWMAGRNRTAKRRSVFRKRTLPYCLAGLLNSVPIWSYLVLLWYSNGVIPKHFLNACLKLPISEYPNSSEITAMEISGLVSRRVVWFIRNCWIFSLKLIPVYIFQDEYQVFILVIFS